MDLLRSVPPGTGHTRLFAPGDAGLSELGLDVIRLGPGACYSGESGSREVAACMLTGAFDATVGGQRLACLGWRRSVFAGKATAVSIPAGGAYTLIATGGGAAEIALCSAPGGEPGAYAPYVV